MFKVAIERQKCGKQNVALLKSDTNLTTNINCVLTFAELIGFPHQLKKYG